MIKIVENYFDLTCLVTVKDLLFATSTHCENLEIIVFVIRNGDIVLHGLHLNHHHPVVRWLPWYDDIKKKICAITLEPKDAEWALVACYDGSLYLVPVLSLLGMNNKENSEYSKWLRHDITQINTPLINEIGFVPCSAAWFTHPDITDEDRHIGILGSTLGHIIVFNLLTADVLFKTKVEGRIKLIEVCDAVQQVYIIITNEHGFQWRIILEPVEKENKQDMPVNPREDHVDSIELKHITTEKDIRHWKMKFKQRFKKPAVNFSVECSKEETILCETPCQLNVKLQSVIKSSLTVHYSCLSAKYPSKIITIEDFSSHVTTVHKLPDDCGFLILTKSFIIFTNKLFNSIKIISRKLSVCKEETNIDLLNSEFIQESLLEEYVLKENERTLKMFCVDYSRDKFVIITNQAFYRLQLKIDPHKLVLKNLLAKENIQYAEKLSLIFNLDLQKLICEAGDIQLSKGFVKEAIHLYNLTRFGGTHLILMLAVLGLMPELFDALRTCQYAQSYKLHFMNLKLLVFLHQMLTNYSKKLHNMFRELLLQSGYDEALAVSVLTQAGLCEELLYLTKKKGLHPITMSVVMHFVRHNHSMNISNLSGFWYLISDRSFCDTLLVKPNFVLYHQKLLLSSLPSLNIDILLNLEALYNPFSVSLRSWITDLVQGDVPLQAWIQTYILICTYLSLRENKINIDTISKISVGQEWKFINLKLGLQENKISAGFNHAAVVIDGNAYAWGCTSFSCLGNGPTNRSVSGPAFIETFFNIGVRVFAISCGRNHTLAITDNGVYSWGNNKYGQLGNVHVVQSSYPSLIEALMEYNIVQIVAGQYHSIALDDKERVLTWGWGVHGQLGHGNIEDCFTPKIVVSLMNEGIQWCDAGQAHTLFLSKNGSVWACGSNTFGQLGTGRNKKSSVPLKICNLTEKIRFISSGYFHNFAVTLSNKIFSWGSSPNLLRTAAHSAKRKMKASTEEKKEPTTIDDTIDFLVPKILDTSLIEGNIVKVVAGSEHNVVLTDTGNLYTWGRNMDGQLGIKTSSITERRSQNILSPTPILFDVQIIDVACGYDFTVCVDSKKKVWSWGANHYSTGNQNALASLEGEIVIVNNKNRVIKFPHHTSNVQPLPTILEIPIEEELKRKDLKPILPPILQSNNWRYRMHYAIETLGKHYFSPAFLKQCVDVGEYDAAAKLYQVSGAISTSLISILQSLKDGSKSDSFIKRIVSYYISVAVNDIDNLQDLLIDVVKFWIQNGLLISHLEDVFYTFWNSTAVHFSKLFFRVDSKYSYFNSYFSTKFKLKVMESMINEKGNYVECILEGCSNVNDVITALKKVDDYVDITLDDQSMKTITFENYSEFSNQNKSS